MSLKNHRLALAVRDVHKSYGTRLIQHLEKVRFMERELAKNAPEIASLLQTRRPAEPIFHR